MNLMMKVPYWNTFSIFSAPPDTKKYQWQAPSTDADAHTAAKKSAKGFLDPSCQKWTIQSHIGAEYTHLRMFISEPAKPQDKLVDHLWALANHCNFPTDEEKERNIQF